MRLHLANTNDIVEHDISGAECICGPRYEAIPDEEDTLVIHHSLDGREFKENKPYDYESWILPQRVACCLAQRRATTRLMFISLVGVIWVNASHKVVVPSLSLQGFHLFFHFF